MEKLQQMLMQAFAGGPDGVLALLPSRIQLTELGNRLWVEAGLPGLAPRTVGALGEATRWPWLDQATGLPWFVWPILMAILGVLSARSVRVGLLSGGLTLLAFYLGGVSASVETLVLAGVALVAALPLGLLLGSIHAAYRATRWITWPLLWLLLTLPLLGTVALIADLLPWTVPSAAGAATGLGPYLLEALLLVAAPLGIMARGSALALDSVDPELARQADRLGASRAKQVLLLTLPLAAPALRAVVHASVAVLLGLMLALGAAGLPGLGRMIWLAVTDGNIGALLLSLLAFWALGLVLDLIFRLTGHGRLRRLEEKL